jgi:hypothetical protein
VVAALLIAALGRWLSWREHAVRLEENLLAISRAVTRSVDRELDDVVALARGWSISRLLQSGDVAGFETRAEPRRLHARAQRRASSTALIDTGLPADAAPAQLPPGWHASRGASAIAPLQRDAVSSD